MKHGIPAALWVARLIERVACAAWFRGKTGKGKISTDALESILPHPGEPIFPETSLGGARCRISLISHHCDLRSMKTRQYATRSEFSTAAHLRACEAPHARRCGKLFHRSSTLNEGSFSVQTGGATSGFVDGFTKKYNVKRLVWFEVHEDVKSAITREKQIKKWNRSWKIKLIHAENPYWRDLYEDLIK